MAKFRSAVLITLVLCFVAKTGAGTGLFDYRGIFPASRDANARITNYMLLKKASKIQFKLEQQGKDISDILKVTSVKLTSDETITIVDPAGINEVKLPETGIYEITIVPNVAPGQEIRFVLRVIEVEDEAVLLPVHDNASVTQAIEQETTQIDQPASAPGIIQLIASETETETPDLSTEATSGVEIATITSPASDQKAEPTKSVVLQSPAPGSFLNHFNGLVFAGDQLHLADTARLSEKIKVFLRHADGREVVVAGSFFSPAENQMAFLPEALVPGAVYNVSLDNIDGSISHHRVPALPEIKVLFKETVDSLLISLSWQPNDLLIRNPSGQIMALTDSSIKIQSQAKQILDLELDKNLLPFGNYGLVRFRARPFELEFSVPMQALEEKSCLVEVLCRVDGSDQPIVAMRADWTPPSEVKETNSDVSITDFSDVVAQNDSSTTVENNVAVEEAAPIPLKELPEETVFNLEQSFSAIKDKSEFNQAWPHDITWDDKGRLWLLDSQIRRVTNFSSQGKSIQSFGSKGEKDEEFGLPVAIAHYQGLLFISDSSKHLIHRLTEDGRHLGTISNDASSGLKIDLPGGICFRNNEMWVADRSAGNIMCFNTTGGYLGSFGSTPGAPINAPISVRADNDALFILERSGLIKKFSPMGSFDATFQTGCREGIGFDVDPWGGIWVCDADKYEVIRFSKSGRRLHTIDAPPGPRPWLPTAISVREDGKIAVTDAQNKMVHIFSPVL